MTWLQGLLNSKNVQEVPRTFFERLIFFNPKPNLYPFLDPGRVIPGNAGGPGPGRRAGSQNPNPLGGCAPQTPARVSSGRSGVQRPIFYCLILLFLIQRHIFLTSYFLNLVNPVTLLVVFQSDNKPPPP